MAEVAQRYADERNATQEEPQTPKGALKPNKMNIANFFVAVKVSVQKDAYGDTTMFNRNSAAGNKKITMFISRMTDIDQMPV